MDCKLCQERLSDYIDNQISEEEKQQIENHIRQCSYCAKELENLKFALESLKELPEIDLPQNFSKELSKKIKNEKKPINSRFLNYKWLSLGASAAVILLMIVFTNLNGISVEDNNLACDTSGQQQQMTMENSDIENQSIRDDNIPEKPEFDKNENTFEIMGGDIEQNVMKAEVQHLTYKNFNADLNVTKTSQALDFLERLNQRFQIKNFNVQVNEEEVIVIFDIPVDVLHDLLEVLTNEYKLENIDNTSESGRQKEKLEEELEFTHIELHIKNKS